MEINVCIGARLKEVREALKLSQTEFAQIAEKAGVPGATRQSQAKYEKGQAAPSAAYLAAIAAAGADVLYVLTGQRQGAAAAPQPAPVGPVLSRRALAVADHFDNTSEEGKKIIEAAAFAAAKPAASTKRGKAA